MKRGKAVTESEPKAYRFAKSVEGAPSLHTDPKIALLACCVADQQRAGFKEYLDLRQFECPVCDAPGFNTGWGVVAYTCGAEYHGDGEAANPCPKSLPPRKSARKVK